VAENDQGREVPVIQLSLLEAQGLFGGQCVLQRLQRWCLLELRQCQVKRWVAQMRAEPLPGHALG
jgi:hypothetical protein